MARIRSIKPEFWASEQVVECSPTARLLFIGMWTFSDDNGIHQASIKRLKMEVFPGDDFTKDDIATLLGELIAAGLVLAYSVNKVNYWRVTGWHHQRIDKPTYRFPLPDDAEIRTHLIVEESPSAPEVIDEASTTPPGVVGEPSPPEWSGGELEWKEQEQEQVRSPKGSRLPEDWKPSTELLAWANTERPDLNVLSETENFRDHWLAMPGKAALKTSWPRTWQKWIRNAYARTGPRQKGQGAYVPLPGEV